jgi:hypothetical protein
MLLNDLKSFDLKLCFLIDLIANLDIYFFTSNVLSGVKTASASFTSN